MKVEHFKLDYNPVETPEFGMTDYMLDAVKSIPAGLEDLAHGVYNLGDLLSFDVLPDWDEERFFERPKTLAGDLTAGLIQYAVPFGFIGKGLSKAGKLAKGLKAGKFFDLKPQGFVAADVATNFIAFDGQQERLSNFLKEVDNPVFSNAVTEYLAADPDDAELEGRLKNVLEGAMIDAGVGALFKLFSVSLKASKRFTKEVANGASKEDAVTTAMMQYQDDAKGLNIVGDIDSQMQFARDRAETDELYRMVGGDPEDIPEVDLRTINWDEVDIDEAAEVYPRIPREEMEAIEAGGKLVDEIEAANGIVKTYEMPGGSTKTVLVDKTNPERVVDFSPIAAAELDVRFAGPKQADIAQEFKEKTLIESVGQRMQTDKPVTAREALQELVNKTGGRLGQYQPVVDKLLALGKGTGIDAKLETRAAASELPSVRKGSFYESGKRRIVFDGESSSFQRNPVYELLHESTHAVTVENVNKYFDADSFNAIDINDIGARAVAIDEVLKKRLPKPIAEMFRMFKKADSMRDEIIAKGDLKTVTGEVDTYWIKNPAEFMSIAFSDPVVQRALKGIEYSPKMSMWEKIVDTVKSFFGKGVSTDLADNIVSRVGEIAEMRLPRRRGRGVEGMFKAFHGTPHIFKPKPDSPFGEFMKSKIGTGEGAQAFGHGFYVAEKEGVARHYYIGQTFKHLAADLEKASGGIDYFASRGEYDEIFDVIDEVIESGGATAFIKESVKQGEQYALGGRADFKLDERKIEFLKAVRGDDYLGFDNPIEGILAAIEDAQGKGPGNFDLSPATRKAAKELGRIYEIDVAPDVDKFMSWDKTMLTQPEKVRKTLKAALEAVSEFDPNFPKYLLDDDFLTGQDVYKALAKSKAIGSEEAASDFLSEMGIPGIRYLQGGKARKAGEGAHNYVVFSEKDLKITGTIDFAPDQPLRKGELDETVQKMVKDADTSSLKIGGEQAVKGLARQTGKLPEGLQVDGLAQLQDAVADEILKDGQMMKILSEQGLEDGVIMELANLLGADGKYMKGLIKAAEQDRVTLHRIMSRMAALKKLALDNGQEIINTAKNYKQGAAKMIPEEREIMEARLKGLLEQQLHIQAGHSGLSSGFGRGLKSTQMGNKITLSEAELKNAQLRQEYLSKKGGMTMDQIVEGILIAEQNGGDDLFAAVIGLNKQVRGSAGGKMLDMVQEYYKNALMWGPRTLTVNYMGTGLAHLLKNFERSVGGWLSADPGVKQAVANQWGESLSLIESTHFLLKAWKTGGQFIGDAGSAFVEGTGSSIGSITGKNVQQILGNEMSDGMKLAIDYFGNAVRIPNRFNQSVDQWYKFLQYKGRSLAQLKLKAYELGLREPKDIAEYAHDAFDALVTRSNRNFSEQALFREADELIQGPFQTPADKSKAVADYVQGERAARLDKARQVGLVDENLDDNAAMMSLTKDYIDPNIRAAEEVTFSGELGPLGAAVQNVVTKSKIGFLVAPFVRTPTNILKFSFDRLLAPHRFGLNKLRATEAWAKLEPGYKNTIDALESGGIKGMENARKTLLEQMRAVKADGTPDELVRAEARGKVAFGTMLNSALFSAVYMFGDRINGGGPEDFKQRQAWLNAGNLPYSIKVPGTETWVSYQRLDPIATMIGVFADIKDLAEDNKLNGVNESSLEHLMSVLFFTGVRNFTNKSYLSGVDQALSMLKGQTPVGKYAGGMTAAFLPNILAQGQSITGDQELKEIRGFADIILKKIPGVTMDLKRTPLGEPVVQEYFDGVAGILNPLNPIAFGFDNKDITARELANVGHGFSMPSTKLRGVIELTDYTGPNGRSAYDRWLELSSQVKLNGRTMKQALTELIKDKRYQALDPKSFTGIPSPRVKFLNRIISRYRKAAQFQMLEEFPEIAELNRNVAAGIRSGLPREDVLELLTQ